MADHTVAGIIGIVAIVLVFGVFLMGSSTPTIEASTSDGQVSQTLAGQATVPTQAQDADTCEPKRFCDGTKLNIVNEDCSVNYAYCQFGCSDARCI